MHFNLRLLGLPFFFLGMVSISAADTLIPNGGFENGLSDWSLTTVLASDNTSNGTNEVQSTTVEAGSYAFESTWGLTASSTGNPSFPENYASLSQTLTGLNIGDSYTVSYYVNGFAVESSTLVEFQASISGQTKTDIFSMNGSSGGWNQESLTFTATGTSAALQFLFRDDQSPSTGSIYLDEVTLNDNGPSQLPTPEPSSWLMGLVGTLTCCGFGIRRRLRNPIR